MDVYEEEELLYFRCLIQIFGEGIVSLVDPETSVKVLTTQVQDTKAKMIICSNHSRKVVFETLKVLNLLGKVKVIVLELAQPKPDQDIPIDVEERNFVFYQDFLKCDAHIQPPSLQNGPLKDEEVFILFWSSGTTGNPKGTKILLEEWLTFRHFMRASCLNKIIRKISA